MREELFDFEDDQKMNIFLLHSGYNNNKQLKKDKISRTQETNDDKVDTLNKNLIFQTKQNKKINSKNPLK